MSADRLTEGAVIEVNALEKRYPGHLAVGGISFRVRRGEIVGFLGPNGAGKTTTLRMLTGYLAPTRGSIRVAGLDALADPIGVRRRIGYMPEGVPLYPEMRVNEYLRYRAALKLIPRRQVRPAVDRALDQSGVGDSRDRIIGQLSKGYRQRVGLADALLGDPPLLILDEPTAGLDPNQIRDVRELIRAAGDERTVLISTHILPEVEATCDRVIILNRGRVVGEGTPDSLRGQKGGQVVSIVGRGDRSRFVTVLEAIDGVQKVVVSDLEARGEGIISARLEGSGATDLGERVFAAVSAAGLVLREMRADTASLEDVFAELTTVDAATEQASVVPRDGADPAAVDVAKAGGPGGEPGDTHAGDGRSGGDDDTGMKAAPPNDADGEAP